MTENKNARSTAPTTVQASVSSFLPCGMENAIPGNDLTKILRLKDLRELTKLIERERRAGVPICATVARGQRGYFVASGPCELENYIHSLDRRIRNVSRTRRSLSAVLDRMTGQQRLGV